jgi:hypothetical protein
MDSFLHPPEDPFVKGPYAPQSFIQGILRVKVLKGVTPGSPNLPGQSIDFLFLDEGGNEGGAKFMVHRPGEENLEARLNPGQPLPIQGYPGDGCIAVYLQRALKVHGHIIQETFINEFL